MKKKMEKKISKTTCEDPNDKSSKCDEKDEAGATFMYLVLGFFGFALAFEFANVGK